MREYGGYVKYNEHGLTYHCFIPPNLPVPVSHNEKLLELISNCSFELGRLSNLNSYISHRALPFLVAEAEAQRSSRIEGTKATLSDLLKYSAGIKGADISKDVIYVENYVRAFEAGAKLVTSANSNIGTITKLHSILLHDLEDSGKIRRQSVFISDREIIDPDQDASYIPPSHGYIKKLLTNLFDYFYSHTADHLFIRIAVFHGQFELIHPFTDGNGRVGRLMTILQLIESGYLKSPSLLLSDYIYKNRNRYYAALENISKNGEMQQWIEFYLEAIHKSARHTCDVLSEIDMRYKRDLEKIKSFGARMRIVKKAIDHLYTAHFITSSSVMEVTGFARKNAISLIRKLTKIGIIKEVTGGTRNRIYCHSSYLDLLK